MENTLSLLRTNADNSDFRALVRLLDAYLADVDGDDHAYFDQFNQLIGIHHVVLANCDGAPVGCGAMKAFRGDVMEVKRMFVRPERRGQGIAAQILAELETWAQEEGYAGLVLETGRKQTSAVRLYEKCGYAVIPNYGPYVGIETSVCMQKTIEPTRSTR